MYINSPGSSITAGMGIYDAMHLVKADVTTLCVGSERSKRIIRMRDNINKILSQQTGQELEKIEKDTGQG